MTAQQGHSAYVMLTLATLTAANVLAEVRKERIRELCAQGFSMKILQSFA
ncbi:hypothetical protein [Hufsiella ginkgonis]|uniref:Uncharacterized protein n=1 Tax=Hufsiella ginkgonis TaxID=2695274 RepID=A0A7K1Y1J6_9SPHI|nr:hypothetical protein [Hufsiella ginkgonis]MXV17072.1 hypothetical protein [Hufsiella ginkgonis]